MSLRKKTFLLTGLALVAMIGIMYVVATRVLLTGYATAEQREIEKRVAEVKQLLSQRVDALDAQCHDWSSWDDTYAFVKDGNSEYRTGNLALTSITVLNTNLLAFIDLSGRVVYGKWFDFKRGTAAPLPAALRVALGLGSPFLEHPRLDQGQRGLLDSPAGLLTVVSRPILGSDGKGPSRGTLVFGRLLTEGALDLIQRATQLSVEAIPCAPGQLPQNLQTVHSRLTASSAVVSQVEGENVIAGYTALTDAQGQHLALLRVTDNRDIFFRGLRDVRAMLVPAALLGLMFGVLILLILERLVLARVAQLSSDVAAVGAAGDPSARVSLSGSDELSGLAARINDTLAALSRSRDQLQERQAQYRDLVETTPDCIWQMDENALYTYVSPKVLDTLGYEPADLLGKTHLDLTVPEEADRVRSEYSAIMARQEAFSRLESSCRHADGRRVVVEISGVPVLDAAGAFRGYRGVARDVTDRKQAEERRQAIIQTAMDGFWLADAQGRFLEVNETYCRMSGYSVPELLAMRISDLEATEGDDETAARIEKIMAQGEDRFESQHRRKDGTIFDVAVSVQYRPDEGGRLVVFVQDITARKQAEEALRQARDDWESTFNSLTDMVTIHDKDYNIIRANDTARQTLGPLPSGDLAGVKCFRRYHGTEGPPAGCPSCRSLETGEPCLFEVFEPHLNKHLEIRAIPRFDADHQCAGLVHIVRDITERKHHEEALAESRRQLQEREAQYRDLVETTPDWIWETDAEAVYTYVSPKVRDTLGYEPAEVLGKTPFELMSLEEAARVAALLAPAAANHEAFTRIESTWLHADGRPVAVETSAVPIFDASGEFRGYRGADRDVTDRKLAEEALRSRTALLEAQTNATTDGILVVDTNQRRVLTNQRWTELLEVPAHIAADANDAAMLEHVVGLVKEPEVFLERVRYLYDHPTETGNEEVEFKNGMTLERYSAPVLGKDGKCYGRIWHFRDITERKQAERQTARLSVLKEDLLRPSTLGEKLRSITDAVVDAMDADFARVWITNPGDRCRSGCPHAELTEGPHVCRHRDRCLHLMASSGRYTHLDGEVHARVPFGCYKIGRVAAGEDEKFITNDVTHDPRVHNHDWAAELGLASFAGYRLMSLDGEHLGVLALFSKRPIGADDDAVLERIADTTSHVIRAAKVEQALAAEKERLRVTLRSVGDAVIATDTEGRVSLVSKIAERMTGWTEAEALGLPITEVVQLTHHDTRETLPVPIAGVLETRQIASLTNHAVLVSRDGAEYLIANSAAPIFDQESRLIGAVLVFRDVTTETHLREEANKAQRLESVGLLAGGIAHDFNNLLTVIMGGVQMAQILSQDTERQTKLLKSAQAACVRAADLTQRLLTFAKGGAPVKQVCSLETIVRETVEFALTGSAVTLELFVEPDLWLVEIDGGQISQVIQNLVINAVQAMPTGGGLHVTLENRPAGSPRGVNGLVGPHVALVVRDEGTGISPAHLAHVFDPYFTTKQQGSGLGLAAAYAIVTQHDGDLSATSQVGTGSVFTVCLPCAPDGVQATSLGASSRSLTRGSGRILVMDDEHSVRDVAALTLGEMGYDVETAAHGEAALEAYRQAIEQQRPFDLVMLDLTVRGGMGGQETIQRLLEINPQVRAIVCSGYSADQVMRQHHEHGFQACVVKPFDVRELARTVQQVLTDGAS